MSDKAQQATAEEFLVAMLERMKKGDRLTLESQDGHHTSTWGPNATKMVCELITRLGWPLTLALPRCVDTDSHLGDAAASGVESRVNEARHSETYRALQQYSRPSPLTEVLRNKAERATEAEASAGCDPILPGHPSNEERN